MLTTIDQVRFRYPIKKSNEIINKARADLTAQEMDVLYYLIMHIKDEDKELKPIMFSPKEYCMFAGINKTNYKKVEESLEALKTKSVWMPTAEKDSWELEEFVSWLAKVIRLKKKEGEVQAFVVEFSEYYAKHLLQQNGNHNTVVSFEVLPMRSSFGKKLYELLKSEIKHERAMLTVEYDIKDLRQIFYGKDKWDKRHKKFKDFRKRVIEPAIQDLADYGYVRILEVVYVKTGKAVTKVRFRIKYKTASDKSKAFKKARDHFADKNKETMIDLEKNRLEKTEMTKLLWEWEMDNEDKKGKGDSSNV